MVDGLRVRLKKLKTPSPYCSGEAPGIHVEDDGDFIGEGGFLRADWTWVARVRALAARSMSWKRNWLRIAR
jgi:hypothetical protein